MAIFAVIKDSVVINKIVCENQSLAEKITELPCLEITDGIFVDIGYLVVDGKFEKPREQV